MRRGETARVIRTNRSVQRPVSFVMSEIGLALNLPSNPFQARRNSGVNEAAKRSDLTTVTGVWLFKRRNRD